MASDFNRFKLEFRRVQQRLEAAENNVELIREGSAKRSGNVSNLVESTVDGMVLDIPVKEGTFIIESNTFNEGTTIATVADMGEMIFEGRVDESEVGRIAVGMDLILSVGAIEADYGQGKMFIFGPKITFRAQPHGTFGFLFNGIYYGAADNRPISQE